MWQKYQLVVKFKMSVLALKSLYQASFTRQYIKNKFKTAQ